MCKSCISTQRAERNRKLDPLGKWARANPENHKENSRKIFLQMHAKLSPEDRSSKGRVARSKVTHSKEAVEKQWETIKSDPEKFAALKKQRGGTAKIFWDSMTPEKKALHFQKVFASSGKGRSKAGDQFIHSLANAGFGFEPEQWVHGFCVDGLDRNRKLIVEFYGEMFHCNPRTFHDPEKYCPWIGRTVGQQWARDRKRLGVFYKNGYRVIIIWEKDWYASPQTQIGRIENALRQT